MIMVSLITVSLISYRFVLFDCFIPLFSFLYAQSSWAPQYTLELRVNSVVGANFVLSSLYLTFSRSASCFIGWHIWVVRLILVHPQFVFQFKHLHLKLQDRLRLQRSLTWPSLKQNSWFKYNAIKIVVLASCDRASMRLSKIMWNPIRKHRPNSDDSKK